MNFCQANYPEDFQFDWGKLIHNSTITPSISNKANIVFTNTNIPEDLHGGNCPDNYWNTVYNELKYSGSVASFPGSYILLWNNTEDSGDNLECVFCYDDNTGGTPIDLNAGSTLEFNTAKAYDPNFVLKKEYPI